MSSEKRRKARVQGAWSTSAPNVRSDRDKQKMAVGPAWLGKNIDQVQPSKSDSKFVYEQPEDEIYRKKIPTQIITKAGVYDLSTGHSGVARVRFFPDFINSDEAKALFEQLFDECPWRQQMDVKNGASYLQPRLTAWFGDHPYSYSGVTQQLNKEWPAVMLLLRQQLEEATGLTFNSCLANLYRDGHDSVDWHSDDEKSLGKDPTIASLSFGDVRNFEMRKKPTQGEDISTSELIRIPLSAGSLLTMEGTTQTDWQHRVPKEYHDRGPRINLTYRVIYPQ